MKLLLVAVLFGLGLHGSSPPLEHEIELGHVGPQVIPGRSGTGRFVEPVYGAFDTDAAMATVGFVDGFYRAPGNDGYNACLDHVSARLAKAGFGKLSGFELEEIVTPMSSPAWTPVSARLSVRMSDGERIVLHAFDEASQVDRVMLPIYSPSADVAGRPVFRAEAVSEGTILVSEDPLSGRTLKRLAKQGALAVISCSNADFTVDSNGGDEHLDAIQFRTMSPNTRLPVAQISKRSFLRLQELQRKDSSLRLNLTAEVKLEEDAPMRTLVARVIGQSRSEEVICVVAHVQEPGAGDNASGVGGICQAAIDLAGLIQAGSLEAPSRTLAFVFGDEMRQSAIWLEHNKRKVLAGISADMLGQSRGATGARCLLERSPDPGALDTLPPDEHTPWGAGRVKKDSLVPSGLSLITRHAMIDVGKLVGGWLTSENPWEGGSDHDIFLRNGIPGILVWHFTDFTYHTGLDRMDRLDGEELHRTVSVILATALTVADLRMDDLERLRGSNRLELNLRVESALEAGRPDVARRWREWCHGVELWLDQSVVDPQLK